VAKVARLLVCLHASSTLEFGMLKAKVLLFWISILKLKPHSLFFLNS